METIPVYKMINTLLYAKNNQDRRKSLKIDLDNLTQLQAEGYVTAVSSLSYFVETCDISSDENFFSDLLEFSLKSFVSINLTRGLLIDRYKKGHRQFKSENELKNFLYGFNKCLDDNHELIETMVASMFKSMELSE